MRFCDNEDVCKSMTKTEAVLIKKAQCAYHPDRKTVATNNQVRDFARLCRTYLSRQGGQR
jgi:hypothetical protein